MSEEEDEGASIMIGGRSAFSNTEKSSCENIGLGAKSDDADAWRACNLANRGTRACASG